MTLRTEMTAHLRSRARALGLVRPRRSHVAAARMLAERRALAWSPRRPVRRNRILCYHAVGTSAWGVNDLSPTRFRRQLELAASAGYRFVPADQLAGGLLQPAPPGRPGHRDGFDPPAAEPLLAVTFDDAVGSVATNAAPILRELDVPWTLFVVGEWADGRHAMAPGTVLGWDGISELAEAGAVIGSHSLTHRDFATLSPEETRLELTQSRQLIRDRTGIEVTDFAIPFGQSANWSDAATAAAHEAGYRWIFAQSERRRPAGTVARTFVTRFDDDRTFTALLDGAFDRWEEWV